MNPTPRTPRHTTRSPQSWRAFWAFGLCAMFLLLTPATLWAQDAPSEADNVVGDLLGPETTEEPAEDVPAPKRATAKRSKFDDEIFVRQRKPFLRKNRVELLPKFATTINDSLIRKYSTGANLTWHISESFWFGGNFSWFDLGPIGGPTESYFETLEKTQSVPDLIEMKWFAGADFGYVPISGKFAIFNSAIVYYDLSVYLGGGWATYLSGGAEGETGTFAGTVGVQQRLFLLRWLALTMDLRDNIFLGKLKSSSGVEDSLTNVVSFGGGISIFMPFGFDYTTAR